MIMMKRFILLSLPFGVFHSNNSISWYYLKTNFNIFCMYYNTIDIDL